MFTFNGIDFSTYIRGVTDIQRPFIAPQKISTTSIEGKAEEVFHRKTSSTYNIDVTVIVEDTTRIALLAKLRTIAGLLDTKLPAQLILHDEADKYVKAIFESAEIKYHENKRFADIVLSFKVLDPYWYAITDDIYNWTATGVKAVTRQGNAESYPLVEIEGVSSTGNYSIGANGSLMTYSGSLATGEKLIIDSTLLTAYILKSDLTKVSVLNKLDVLDFPTLTKGDNNFTIAMGGGATLTNVKLICNSRWK